MFVSFLQRFGFLAPSPAAGPLESPATKAVYRHGDRIASVSVSVSVSVSPATAHPQAPAQRRQDVKVPSKKNKVSAKPIVQSVAKPASKLAAKPGVKAAPAKAVQVVKQLSKTSVKKAAPVQKSAAKEVIPPQPVAKSVIKPVAKRIVNAAAKPFTQTFSASIPPSSAKAALPSAAKAASIPTKSALAPQPSAPAAPKTMITPPPALKPGRRSSARTAAQSPPPAPMVPTHAPDAAKASYSAITERVISPPPHVAARKDPKLANNWKTKEASELTDEEIKAMPDSEYMNDKQLAFFRSKLSILKSEIHASAGQTTEHLREDTVVVPDPADRATIEEEHALELRTRDRERKLLKKIEQSISRIDAGDYGYCDETGEAIGVGRLIARPTASLSLEAQQRRELKQKLFGD
jgi:DnaK suppressor protein